MRTGCSQTLKPSLRTDRALQSRKVTALQTATPPLVARNARELPPELLAARGVILPISWRCREPPFEPASGPTGGPRSPARRSRRRPRPGRAQVRDASAQAAALLRMAALPAGGRARRRDARPGV